MPLTGRFTFRKSLLGRIILQVEEDAPMAWPFSLSGRCRRRWRDAHYMDLVQPQIRGLLNLRDYAQESPQANFAAPVFAQTRRRHALDRLPQPEAPAAAGGGKERHGASTLHGTVA